MPQQAMSSSPQRYARGVFTAPVPAALPRLHRVSYGFMTEGTAKDLMGSDFYHDIFGSEEDEQSSRVGSESPNSGSPRKTAEEKAA